MVAVVKCKETSGTFRDGKHVNSLTCLTLPFQGLDKILSDPSSACVELPVYLAFQARVLGQSKLTKVANRAPDLSSSRA